MAVGFAGAEVIGGSAIFTLGDASVGDGIVTLSGTIAAVCVGVGVESASEVKRRSVSSKWTTSA